MWNLEVKSLTGACSARLRLWPSNIVLQISKQWNSCRYDMGYSCRTAPRALTIEIVRPAMSFKQSRITIFLFNLYCELCNVTVQSLQCAKFERILSLAWSCWWWYDYKLINVKTLITCCNLNSLIKPQKFNMNLQHNLFRLRFFLKLTRLLLIWWAHHAVIFSSWPLATATRSKTFHSHSPTPFKRVWTCLKSYKQWLLSCVVEVGVIITHELNKLG